MCSTSLWEQLETLASTAMVGDGDVTTGLSAVIVREPRGGCGAAEVSFGSTGIASTTRGLEDLDCVAATPEDREDGPVTTVVGEEVGASRASFTFSPLDFFILAAAAGGDGDKGAGGEGSERSDAGTDPNRALEEDDVE